MAFAILFKIHSAYCETENMSSQEGKKPWYELENQSMVTPVEFISILCELQRFSNSMSIFNRFFDIVWDFLSHRGQSQRFKG